MARLPFERTLAHERLANAVTSVQLDLSLRERVSQNEFIAALGGFRSLVADLLWIEAMTDWERVEYGKMNLKFGTVTTLVPHNVMFWDMSAWHMAYNASVAVMDDRNEPKEAIRKKRQREYFASGKDYIERGIANNPHSHDLYQMLAKIDAEKLADHWLRPGLGKRLRIAGMRWATRNVLPPTNWRKCPGHEREAYDWLRSLYDQGQQGAASDARKQTSASWRRNFRFRRNKGFTKPPSSIFIGKHHAFCDFRRHSREPRSP